MKNFEALVTEDLRRLIDEDLKQRLSDVKDNFTKEITRLSIKVIGIRGGRSDNFVMKQILNQSEQTMMQNSINDLVQILKDLKDKEQLQYSNVAKSDSEHIQNEMLTEHQLVVDAEPDQMLDSSDIVLILVASTETDENMDDHMTHVSSTTTQISSPPPTEPQTAVLSSTDVDMSDTSSSPIQVTPPNECEPINILLLGETGVGKSTFINAFANYLTFNTLQQAEKSQPVVLIPVSFLITVGNNFDEHIVKFGDVDDSNNEDFEHPGQSVTQHCKSYVFNLDRNHRQKVCIIDTPGFGDTRGIDQDDYNMAHILEYIRDLSHLDAICFLLKPNQSRLNIFYRSCLTQLSSFRKSNSCANILFCFTNARSTFYTPGDTAPLLRTMLKSLPMADINFKKENTFCFDSESFRYLVALQNGISFDDLQREEYEMSWTKSVSEANRLVHYLCEILSPHRIRDQ
jgi:GTP-binding protein EngB required for normal cell division